MLHNNITGKYIVILLLVQHDTNYFFISMSDSESNVAS